MTQNIRAGDDPAAAVVHVHSRQQPDNLPFAEDELPGKASPEWTAEAEAQLHAVLDQYPPEVIDVAQGRRIVSAMHARIRDLEKDAYRWNFLMRLAAENDEDGPLATAMGAAQEQLGLTTSDEKVEDLTAMIDLAITLAK